MWDPDDTNPHARLFFVFILRYINGFFDVAEYEIAMAIVCLKVSQSATASGSLELDSYMKAAFQLAVATEFDDDNFVDAESHKV